MSSEVAVIVGLFSKAFEEAKRLGVSVRIEPPTTPTPKDSYAIGMNLLVFEPAGASIQRAIKGEREVLRKSTIVNSKEETIYGS